MADSMHFEAHALNYADARPPYPRALWKSIRDLGVLRPGAHAVDLGAGTGQATGPLLAAGLRVTAVEPGPVLAAQLEASYPMATVVVARAEDIDLPECCVDLAVAATSIHWMDLDIVLPKVHRLLVPGGTLLVWRNVFEDLCVPRTPFRERVAEIVRGRDAPPRPGPDPEVDDDGVHRLFTTFSDWRSGEVDQAAEAVRRLGGRVVEHYTSWLITPRPVAEPPAPRLVGENPRAAGSESDAAAGDEPADHRLSRHRARR